jgi:hypothetical protein
MAGKLLPLSEAASLLGVTPEELNELRLSREIYGYRDGSSWKFKSDDVERLREERAAAKEGPLTGGDDDFMDMLSGPSFDAEIPEEPVAKKPKPAESAKVEPAKVEDEDEGDLVLLSEVELGESGPSTSSTVIGQSSNASNPADSDLHLGGSGILSSGSGLNLADSGVPLLAGDSGLGLGPADSVIEPAKKPDNKKAADKPKSKPSDSGLLPISASDSDVRLADEEDHVFGSGSELPIGLSESATVVKQAGSSELIANDSVLLTGGRGESGIELSGLGLVESPLGKKPAGNVPAAKAPAAKAPAGKTSPKAKKPADNDALSMQSDIGIAGAGDSALNLADDDVLSSGSSSGSDITHRPSDSGILLLDPSDSGLSLERPLELGASGSDPMMATTEFSADSGDFSADSGEIEAMPELSGEDDFLLTPSDELTEDASDSGSQVIMLDTEGEFEDATATLLAGQIPGLGAITEDDSPLGGLGGMGGAAPASPLSSRAAAAAAAQAAAAAVPEVPFSAFSVLMLAGCSVVLAFSGILVYDVVRNMWSWDNPYGVSSVIISTIGGMLK